MNFTGQVSEELFGDGSASVCEHYSLVIKKIRKKALIARNETVSKVNDIGMYIPVFQSGQHAREKCDLLSAAAMVLGGAFSFVNTIVTHHRRSNLEDSVKNLRMMEGKSYQLSEALRQHLVTFATVTDKNIKTLFSEVRTTRLIIKEMAQQWENKLLAISIQTGQLIDWHSYLASYTMRMSLELDDYSARVLSLVNRLRKAMHKLSTGVLPEELNSHFQLANAIEHARETMVREQPYYELVETKASRYFKASNIGYAENGFDLVVQVPAHIKLKNHPLFDLYRIETFHVPYDTYNANTHDDKDTAALAYTKLNLDTHYFASSEDNYILIDGTRISQCERSGTVAV